MADRDDLDALMRRLAEGDRAAFGPLFEQLWPLLARYCRSVLGPADADDAAQEALQKVLERAHQYDDSRAALPWALTIAHWECRTVLKRRARRREVDVEQAAALASNNEEAKAIERDLVRLALSAFDELSEQDRQTLTATLQESAEAQGATQRKRRERAWTRLRTTIKRLYGVG